ncbi:MAG: hypothetical protein MMC23_000625 [Stictis urceolatum]|nr:hypothetical protein [Stictis urceolata]
MASSSSSAIFYDGEPSDFFSETNSEVIRTAEELTTTATSTYSPSSTNTLANNIRKRKHESYKAKSTWEHFRRAQGHEPDLAADSQRLWYCKRCISPKWYSQVSGNARKHLATAHHISVEPEPSKGKKARHEELKDIFARVSAQKVEKIE